MKGAPMRILIDADACPVVSLAEGIARGRNIAVVIFCDTHHLLRSDYAIVRTVSAGRDAVDLALINECMYGDVVITQDYGVAALALGKGAYALHQDGWEYTPDNIEFKLMERHLAGKMRRSHGKHHLKGPRARTREADLHFEYALKGLLDRLTNASLSHKIESDEYLERSGH